MGACGFSGEQKDGFVGSSWTGTVWCGDLQTGTSNTPGFGTRFTITAAFVAVGGVPVIVETIWAVTDGWV
jgi:hypothetical protein